MIVPQDWPVLVTGAGGFVGGHVARDLARAGHPVRGLARRLPPVEPDDPPIDWRIGDLLDPKTRSAAVSGVRGIVHSAGWVSLGPDPLNQAVGSNIEATLALLADASAAGVERFVFTSTLHTLAAGTAEAPADEDSIWNLDVVDSPYARTKRAAERQVLEASNARMACLAICPGMVIGPRDLRPTSTGLLLAMARTPVAILPGGGIPIIDARVLAQAHRQALEWGEPGRRYAVVGPYLSYLDMARLVARLTGRPWIIGTLPDATEGPLSAVYQLAGRLSKRLGRRISRAMVAGGYLRLHVRGDHANAAFGLVHPPPIKSIGSALEDARRSGRAPWLRLRAGQRGLQNTSAPDSGSPPSS
ncbi:hypothetical protein BH23PLA1_BH23PLA1_13330 [soil metagenome]